MADLGASSSPIGPAPEPPPFDTRRTRRATLLALRRPSFPPGALVITSQWAAAVGIMILALRPIWSIPLQADDFLALFYINGDNFGVWDTTVQNTQHSLTNSGTHFNPVGIFLESLLKAWMLATDSPILTMSVLHYGTIVGLMLLALPIVTRLLSRLLRVSSGIAVTSTALAIPVAVGFALSAQITAPWAMYDPLVTHPIFAALPTVVGLAYLSSAVGALERRAPVRRVVLASALGVVGFLVYESLIVFVAALVMIAWLGRRRGFSGFRSRLPWLIVPPVATFLVSQLIIAGRPDAAYTGTSFTIDLATAPAWMVSMTTSQPGALWGIASRHVDLSRLVPSALIGAVLVGAALLGWLLWGRTRRAVPAVDDAAATRVEEKPTSLDGERAASHALVPVVALALCAPVPFLVSRLWVSQLEILGTTYMHSLIVLWCWAMALALIAIQLVRSRGSVAWLVLASLVVTGWVGVQLSINRQLSAELTAHPTVGIDVAEALQHPAPREEDRCAMLFAVRPRPDASLFISLLNREFEERYGEPFCTSEAE